MSLVSSFKNKEGLLTNLGIGLKYFIAGIVLAVLCNVMAYITLEHITKQREKPWMQVVCVLLALGSLVMFSWGSYNTLKVFG